MRSLPLRGAVAVAALVVLCGCTAKQPPAPAPKAGSLVIVSRHLDVPPWAPAGSVEWLIVRNDGNTMARGARYSASLETLATSSTGTPVGSFAETLATSIAPGGLGVFVLDPAHASVGDASKLRQAVDAAKGGPGAIWTNEAVTDAGLGETSSTVVASVSPDLTSPYRPGLDVSKAVVLIREVGGRGLYVKKLADLLSQTNRATAKPYIQLRPAFPAGSVTYTIYYSR